MPLLRGGPSRWLGVSDLCVELANRLAAANLVGMAGSLWRHFQLVKMYQLKRRDGATRAAGATDAPFRRMTRWRGGHQAAAAVQERSWCAL